MKHVVFLGDGMADEPFAPLGGHTPLELARHPGMDFLASQGEFGLTRTVPPGKPLCFRLRSEDLLFRPIAA